jgi:peptidoglycan/LPS O-acetylase OafA/YrhL
MRDHQLVGRNCPVTKNALLHLQVLGCLLFSLIVYFISGQPSDMDRFNMFFVISLLIVYVAMSFGLMIGAIFDVVVSSRQTVLVPKHHDVMMLGAQIPGD